MAAVDLIHKCLGTIGGALQLDWTGWCRLRIRHGEPEAENGSGTHND